MIVSSSVGDLVRARLASVARPSRRREAPGVAERAAGEHDGCGGAALERAQGALLVGQSAGEDDRDGEPLGQLARHRVVRAAGVLLGGVARMEGDRGDAGVGHEPLRQLDAAAIAGLAAGPELDGDRQAARPPPRRAASATALAGSSSRAAPAPVLHTLRTGQPMLRSIRSAPASAAIAAASRMTSGSCPNSWIDTGCSSGWMRRNSRTVRSLP